MTTTDHHSERALADIAEKLAKAALDIALVSSKLGPAVDHCTVVVSCFPFRNVTLRIIAPDQSHAQSILDTAWDNNLFTRRLLKQVSDPSELDNLPINTTYTLFSFETIEVVVTTSEDKTEAVHKAGLALCRDLLTSTEQQETT